MSPYPTYPLSLPISTCSRKAQSSKTATQVEMTQTVIDKEKKEKKAKPKERDGKKGWKQSNLRPLKQLQNGDLSTEFELSQTLLDVGWLRSHG